MEEKIKVRKLVIIEDRRQEYIEGKEADFFWAELYKHLPASVWDSINGLGWKKYE